MKHLLWGYFAKIINSFYAPTKTYSEPCQSLKMQCFSKIVNVNRQKPPTILAKRFILDVCHVSEYASDWLIPQEKLQQRSLTAGALSMPITAWKVFVFGVTLFPKKTSVGLLLILAYFMQWLLGQVNYLQ